MASVIIDGKKTNGKRTSVSVHPMLAGMAADFLGGMPALRTQVRDFISQDLRSEDVFTELLYLVAKPSLVSRAQDGQFDIEDY